MARRSSLTSQLYRAARASNTARVAARGPGAYVRRAVRRKVYAKQMAIASSLLKAFGLRR